MVYIFESELPINKSVLFALTTIFGIGKLNSFLVCKKLGFSQNLKIKNLSEEQTHKLIKNIELLNLILASDLKKERLLIFEKLLTIKSYRGLRRNQGLPV